MITRLPQPIAVFIQAKNNHDSDALITCFTSNAVVHDEGEEFRGTTAIKEWGDRVIKKYQVTLNVTDVVERDHETVATVLVSGNFDGSPISLDFHFTLSGDKISELKIL